MKIKNVTVITKYVNAVMAQMSVANVPVTKKRVSKKGK